MIIRNTTDTDLDDVLHIHREAFGEEEEADLVNALFDDKTARPIHSLLAIDDGKPVGHILFTRVQIRGNEDTLSAMILAPLAVLPGAQGKDVGGKLTHAGLQQLQESSVDLVLVLGHPGYYPRFGFKPAGALGFEAPYPIPAKDAAAWMVMELRPGVIGDFGGRVICADALNHPEMWRE